MKIVIIGGVAGGATAAARIRRLDEKSEILVFERSGFISYANCGLPYYIGGAIKNKNDLTLQTPESFFKRFRVKVKVRHEVMAIHPESKTVTVKNLESGEVFTESYDKLLISTGAKSIKPNLEGIDSCKIFTLRTIEDTLKIKNYINERQPKNAVVVGGGFVGIEVSENLRELGMSVTLVEATDQLTAAFDSDMASFIHAQVRKNGVNLLLSHAVESFSDTNNSIDVKLKDCSIIHADMVVMAIGVSPENTLAKDAGIELGIKGSIVVNDRMETSVHDIYAVGDVVQIKNFVTDSDTLISLAGPANKQARIAADNICGGDSRYKGGQGSSIIKVFDMTAASTGINEKTAKLIGVPVDKIILSP
ncbi:MAG: FAD-dependent oxidoreductase, partial [Clostridia bacterium]|nr:FAD-dependent oxidoreductase [Clostridia bacterium]